MNIKIISIKKNFILEKLKKDFLLFKNWEEKYQYIIDLSKIIITMPKSMKNNNNMVYDCQSQVWCNANFKNNKIILYGDSDSLIIKGLISIIFIFFNNCSIRDINNLNFIFFLKKYKIIENLTINRSHGIIYIEKFLKDKINKLISKKIKSF